MGAPAFDNLAPHPSLLSRRTAGGPAGLSTFDLPHPQPTASNLSHKYPGSSSTSGNSHNTAVSPQHSTSNVRVGSLLTPPSNHPSDTFSLASNQFSPYSQGYWTGGSNSYSFNTGRSSSHQSGVSDSLPSYSHVPPYQSPLTSASSTSEHQEQHQHHPHDQQQHQSHQQAQQQQQHHPHSPQTHHHHQSPQQQQQHQQPQQALAHAMTTPSTGSVSGPPSHQSYPSYPSVSSHPLHQQTVTSSSAARISPIPASQFPQFTRPYPSYSLPAMTGPIMSNVHNPSSQMALLGPPMQQGLLPGFNSGHAAAASMSHMYGTHGPPHGHAPHTHGAHGLMQQAGGPQTDRPFRCDSCPQSFSRNHDLKRHKRIHLAVKPFPCKHCDKSFSRKDALKRHILVKGCGRDQPGENSGSSSLNTAKDEDDRHRLSSNDTS